MSKQVLFITDVCDFDKRKIKKGVHYEMPELQVDYVKDFLWAEMDKGPTKYGLAKYIHEDEPLYNKVFAIGQEMHGKQCVFTCMVSNDFDEEKDTPLLKEYLDGQISDGWGENGVYIWSAQDGSRFKTIFLRDNVKRCYAYTPVGAWSHDDYEYLDSEEAVMKRYYEDRDNLIKISEVE